MAVIPQTKLVRDEVVAHPTKANTFIRRTILEQELTVDELRKLRNQFARFAAGINPNAEKTKAEAEKTRLETLVSQINSLLP